MTKKRNAKLGRPQVYNAPVTEIIKIKVTESEKLAIKSMAETEGGTISSFIRQKIGLQTALASGAADPREVQNAKT